jgi:hypothetical protein
MFLTFTFFPLALNGSKALRWTEGHFMEIEAKMVMGLGCHQHHRDALHHPQGHAGCGFRRAFWRGLIQDALHSISQGDLTGRCRVRVHFRPQVFVFGWKVFRMDKFAFEWHAKPQVIRFRFAWATFRHSNLCKARVNYVHDDKGYICIIHNKHVRDTKS